LINDLSLNVSRTHISIIRILKIDIFFAFIKLMRYTSTFSHLPHLYSNSNARKKHIIDCARSHWICIGKDGRWTLGRSKESEEKDLKKRLLLLLAKSYSLLE